MLSPKSLMRSLRLSGQLPVHDFLAPALFVPNRRCISTTPPKTNASAAPPSQDGPAAAPKPKRKPLTKEQREFLSSAVSNAQKHNLVTFFTGGKWNVKKGEPSC